jgi:hypothetical protein
MRIIEMKTSLSASAVAENQKATAPVELTVSETGHVAGGAVDAFLSFPGQGHAYGAGQGLGSDNPHSQGLALGEGKGNGASNGNGRF